jgi:hypothetical protein
VENRLEMLFNKRIQQRTLKVSLWNEEDLKILRLFLTKIKLDIEEIFIDGEIMMTKEDFELIKP